MRLIFPLCAAFLAVPLTGDALQEFQRLQNMLKEYGDILSFQRPDTPHLTLQYWAELMEIEYGQVLEQSQHIAAATSRFDLLVEGVRTFGHRGKDRVLYLHIPFSEDLARLKKRCPWPSLEPFSPHITLAHIRHPERFSIVKKKILKILGQPQFTMKIDRLRLYAMIDQKRQTPLHDFVIS